MIYGEMANRKIKVVTFDLDDTLWPVGPVIMRAEQVLRDWMTQHAPEAAGYDRDTLMRVRAEIVAEQPDLTHQISRVRELVLGRIIAASGYHENDAQAIAAKAFEVFLTARHDVDYYEDVQTSLAALANRYVLGAVSNGNASVHRLEVGKFFSFAVSAEQVGVSKPDQRVFDATLAAAECAAHEVVHVGDHHEHDIAGAHTAGMHTVWINREGASFPGDYPPSASIASLSELVDIIENL